MFDQDLIDKVNERSEYSGNYYENLFENYHFETFSYNINKHTCIVVASFISYLGTNGGYQFFADAERFKNLPDSTKFYAYELAWAYENMRRYGHNGGYRSIEFLLNPADNHPGINGRYFKPTSYNPTVEDYEIIEHTCKWLGSHTGQVYLQKCLEDIKQEKEIRAEYEFKRNR